MAPRVVLPCYAPRAGEARQGEPRKPQILEVWKVSRVKLYDCYLKSDSCGLDVRETYTSRKRKAPELPAA
jgi:hypothetical protein